MGFKNARIAAGKTIKDVMEFLGVSDAAVYQWETGVYVPRVDKMLKLAEFYGTTVDALLKEDEPDEAKEAAYATNET